MPPAHTTGSIAHAVQGRLVGPADLPIADLAAMDQAGERSLTFIRDRKYARQWAAAKAAAALVSDGMEVAGHDPSRRALIYVTDADLAMITVLEAFEIKPDMPPVGIHPTAQVSPAARVAATARIGPLCTVGPGTVIGEHCTLVGRVTLGSGVILGPGTLIHPGVVIYDRITVGAQVILHANVVLGADGFGYRPDPQGRGLIKIPHVGTVTIGNGVEIGACSCVDRGKFGPTVIGDGAKIDNHVQIAHNCRIGRCALICGMTGIAGSVTIGDGAIVGGGVGIADNRTIGPGARIGAKSAVMCDVPAGETWSGMPAAPHRRQLRTWSAARELPDVLKDLRNFARRGGATGPASGAGA